MANVFDLIPKGNATTSPRNDNLFGRISQARQMLSGKDPNVLMNQMIQTNPQFREFVNQNKGRDPREICRSYGIDPNVINNIRL